MSQISFQHRHPTHNAQAEKALEPVMRDYPGWSVHVMEPANASAYGFKLYRQGPEPLQLVSDYIRPFSDPPALIFPEQVADAVRSALERLVR